MLRVGKIEYLNTLPVYYGFVTGKVVADVELVEGVPSELNKLMREGKIDIAVISSYEYLSNRQVYLLLPDFSISAYKKVYSVLFFSKFPIHQLHKKDVWITKSSMTSRELLKFLLENVYGVSPVYRYYSLSKGELPKNPTAILSIGDDALKLLKEKRYPFVYDLAEEWFNLTGKPFVFAVWACRREVFSKKKEEVKKFYEKLCESRDLGLNAFSEICENYSKKLDITVEDCLKYLHSLKFTLGKTEIEGLKEFAKLLKLNDKLEFAWLWENKSTSN